MWRENATIYSKIWTSMYFVFASVSKTAGYWKQYVMSMFLVYLSWFREFRLQEKLTNLENENHVLRQKAFNTPAMNNLAVAPKTLSEVIFLLPFPSSMLLLLTPLPWNTIRADM